MTLYVNGYNQQFQNFVDFASQKVEAGKGKSIARMDGATGNLGGHAITAAKHDGVGGLSAFFRSKAKETVNNATRDNFKQAIIDMFGGESKIPESVKTAMRLQDYGAGKPLTARRIMIVKTAIDNVSTKFQNAFQAALSNANNAYSKAGENGKAMMDDRIRNIIASCIDNPDLLDIVVNNMDSILVRGDNELRSEASVQTRINELKDNYAELQRLAKDDPSVLAPGKSLIAALNGKSLPKGLIEKMVRQAKTEPIKALTNLSASSSAKDIHKAITQFLNAVNDVMTKSDAEILMEGSDEKMPCRDFTIALIMARCGKSTIRKMQAALNTEMAAKLLSLYTTISNGNINKTGMSKGLIQATRDQGDARAVYINQLKQAVDMACGISQADFEPLDEFNGQFNFADINAGDILRELIDAGKAQLAVNLENYLQETVKGSGKGVAELRDVIKNKLGPEAYDPHEIVRKDANKIAKSMLNWTFVADCKQFAEGKATETLFYEDHKRGVIVNLPNGKKLSSDFATACDEIAQFVTGKADATYAGLDAKAKGKAHVVMSLLSQDSMKAATESNPFALDPNKARKAFSVSVAQEKDARVFTLELTKTGVLFVNFEANDTVKGLIVDGNLTEVGQGSKYSSKFTLQISSEEFDRLAELDYKQFDSEAAQKVFDSSDKDHYVNTVNSFAPQFKFDPVNASCDTTFSVTIN